MAGAVSLCDDDPEGIALQVAIEKKGFLLDL